MNISNRPRSDKAFAEVLHKWEIFMDPVPAHDTILHHLATYNSPSCFSSYKDGYVWIDEIDDNKKTPFIDIVLCHYNEKTTIVGLKKFVEELLFDYSLELEEYLGIGDTEECDYPDEDTFLKAIDYEKVIEMIKICWERACLSEEEYLKILVK